jgi:hypothetical protein
VPALVAIVSSSVVEERQTDLAEPLPVGEEVDLGALADPDGRAFIESLPRR